jgi:GR25 family glycosyltransferase involved in LPS biosynthesis
MKAYVIRIKGHTLSEQAAKRCIQSAAKNGLEVYPWDAYTPKDDPIKILKQKGINPKPFNEVYSRTLNCAAAFLSHYSLWQHSIEIDEPVVIFEHDAVVNGEVPVNASFTHVMTFSAPSYGKYNTPPLLGVNPLTQKRYFGGAHGYIVNPTGAKELIIQSKKQVKPADVFLNLDYFPWLQEHYPWSCTAMDNFTTIQTEVGCKAKHRYGESYAIV